MGMAAIGTNALNWATKIGDTVNSVLDTAQPFIDLYNKGREIEQSFRNAAKPRPDRGDAAVAPGQIPTEAQLAATPPKTVSQSNGHMPLILGAVAIGAILLLRK